MREKIAADAVLIKNKATVSRPKKVLPIDETLSINITKETAVIEAREEDEDEEILKSFKRK